MEDIVVIDGEVELENTLDGEVELMSLHSLDPQVYLGTGGGSIVVDTAMSDTSENAVQNKVIKAYVDSQGGGSADPATSARYGTVKAQYSHEPSTAQLKLTFHAPTLPQETEISAISPTVQVDGSGNVTQAIYAKYLPDATSSKKGAVIVDSAMSSSSQNPVQNSVVKSYIDSVAGSKTWFGSITDDYDELSGEGYNSSLGGFARTVTTSTGDFTLTDKNTLVIRNVVFSGQYKHFINVDNLGYKEILLSSSTSLMTGKTETYVLGELEVIYNSTADAYMVTNGWSFKKPDDKATVSSYGNVQIGYNNDPAGGWVRVSGGDKVLYAPLLLVSNAGTSPTTPSSETIRAKWLPSATSSAKGAVILKSSITPGDTNAVNSVAVIDYIASVGGGLTNAVKEALLDCFEHVAWIDGDGQEYYDALESALYGLESISAVYTQSGTVYDTDTLDSLKTDLVVTATYSDSSTATVPSADYTLSGTLTAGTSTITVTYEGKTTTFNVTVSTSPYVTDGLIAYWDGIDNTGSGHDSSATKWTDIVGGYELTLANTTKATWDADAITFNGTVGQGLSCNSFWTRPTNATIEVVLLPSASSTQVVATFDRSDTTLSGSNYDARRTILYNDGTVGFAGKSGYTYTSPVSITTIRKMVAEYTDFTVNSCYVNGTTLSLSSKTHSFTFSGNSQIRIGVENMNTSGSTSYPFNGKVYAIRVYNRQLTSEELAKNLTYDNTRFNLGL